MKNNKNISETQESKFVVKTNKKKEEKKKWSASEKVREYVKNLDPQKRDAVKKYMDKAQDLCLMSEKEFNKTLPVFELVDDVRYLVPGDDSLLVINDEMYIKETEVCEAMNWWIDAVAEVDELKDVIKGLQNREREYRELIGILERSTKTV